MNSSEQSNETKRSMDLVKAKSLLQILESDLDACDFKWTLFVAAANNYKYDSLLKPFPSAFIANKVLCIERLRETIAYIPAFDVLLPKLQDFCDHTTSIDNTINDETIGLLYWCLISVKEPILKSINRTNFDSVLKKVISVVPGPRPTHIFEVCTSSDSIAEEKFRSHQTNNPTTFGYHGSKLESFHSILNYGLQQHLCKTALYGEGIYLSSELSVSLMFSSTNIGWENSRCGRRSSCLAICEFVNHPIHLKCHTKEKSNPNGVPDKYFVITNNEIVRVRYLIVYGSEMKAARNSRLTECSNMSEYAMVKWIHRHKWIAAMITYAAILLIIGASNSRHGYYMRQYMRQATLNAIDYLKTFNLFGFNYIKKLFG
ncbi:protein mono-ADP-ribosyltransferase PARP16 [Sitodiplosis mosellana]|uniref:protein mono-ADP-ribosyltransferase PARP16 n=1 Tax=Sitodiplosis mosellana TaxID=263140 RepID=UPI0024444B86|nr:protein mono-ADP-ribosyltransferase PARP16 [Sitodiplosis mosellana]